MPDGVEYKMETNLRLSIRAVAVAYEVHIDNVHLATAEEDLSALPLITEYFDEQARKANHMNNNKPILTLDFDGVLHTYVSGWKGADVVADGPVEGAMVALATYGQDFDVNIFSTRNHQEGGVIAMQNALVQWLTEEEDAYVMLGERGMSPEGFVSDELKFPLYKPPSLLLIDDRCMRFTGRWPSAWEITNFLHWQKIPSSQPPLHVLTTRADLDNRFTYHSPKGDQNHRYVELRANIRELADLIIARCPDSQERSLALTKLEEAMMWANASIARNE